MLKKNHERIESIKYNTHENKTSQSYRQERKPLGSSLKSTKTLLYPAHLCWMEDNLFHILAGSRRQRLLLHFFSGQVAITQPMPFF